MKRHLFFLVLAALFPLRETPALALTVKCTNCSTTMLQTLEQLQSYQQMVTLIADYSESVEQTAQQIRMVQQNIEQYANMLQNTAQLPSSLVGKAKGEISRLAGLSSRLRTFRGDLTALGEIFTSLYPEQTRLRGFAGAITPAQIEAANKTYRDFYDSWSENVDRAAMATFQLSGQQLDDLQKDSEGFQAYLDDLLSTPDGQMKAMMAGNQLAAVQIQEARQLRELMATSIQSQLQSQMKGEKLGQTQEEFWREMTKTDKLENLVPHSDPF